MIRLARLLWRLLSAPFAWLGPGAGRSGRSVYRRTWVLLASSVVVSNLVGAVIVFVYATWVIPGRVEDQSRVVLANFVAFAVYVSVALVVGVVLGTRALRSVGDFLTEEREPDRREQRVVVRGPFRVSLVAFALWALAVPLFAALNAAYDLDLVLPVGLTVFLGGLTTSAIAYLLSERLLRAAAARALAANPPERPLVPGVIFRSLLAWALGTGVPVVGLMIVAIFALADEEISRRDLAITILGLGGLALIVGLLAVVMAARAASDPIVAVREALRKVERDDLDVEVPIYDGSEVGLLQAGFNRMVDGLRERRRTREALGAYVDHEVARRILEEGVALEGEDVEVTVLFLDVRDFTGFAEAAGAREVVDTLNRLYDRIVPIVHEHGGHIDKFVGDGLLAVFGAPRRTVDHAERAVAAACQIAGAVSGNGGSALEIGIGINSGQVVAGNVGGGGRLEFTVIGDAVNVAARIEAATRETGDTILISERTRERVAGDGRSFRERTGIDLKGKTGTVKLFAVE